MQHYTLNNYKASGSIQWLHRVYIQIKTKDSLLFPYGDSKMKEMTLYHQETMSRIAHSVPTWVYDVWYKLYMLDSKFIPYNYQLVSPFVVGNQRPPLEFHHQYIHASIILYPLQLATSVLPLLSPHPALRFTTPALHQTLHAPSGNTQNCPRVTNPIHP